MPLRRDSDELAQNYGNASDDEVENYPYDYYFDNNAPLEETAEKFTAFLRNIARERGITL